MKNLYVPALLYYTPLMNLTLEVKYGDGQNEQRCWSNFTNLEQYDAYALNIVDQTGAAKYLDKLH